MCHEFILREFILFKGSPERFFPGVAVVVADDEGAGTSEVEDEDVDDTEERSEVFSDFICSIAKQMLS